MLEKEKTSNLFTAIEIGTESVKVLMGRSEGSRITLLGQGDALSNRSEEDGAFSKNVWKGKICNLVAIQEKLSEAIREAEEDAGIKVEDTNVYLGMSGLHTCISQSEAEITLGKSDNVVSAKNIADVVHQAREAALEDGRYPDMYVMQTYTRFFQLDDGRMVVHALGQSTRRLRAFVLHALCPEDYSNNLRAMIRKITGTTVTFLYNPALPAYFAMDWQAPENGFLTIDVGAGVTSYAVTSSCCFVQLAQIPVGCNHILNDLMQAFGIDYPMAKRILSEFGKKIGGSLSSTSSEERMIDVAKREGRRSREIPLSSVEKVISLRLEELFTLIRKHLVSENVWYYVRGCVLLSGGGAMIPGVMELASRVFERECRPVVYADNSVWNDPRKILHDDPRFVVPAGLLCAAVKDKKTQVAIPHRQEGFWAGIWQWFKDVLNF